VALNRQIQTLSSQVYKLQGVREKQADVGAEIDSIRQEVQRLSGILEEDRHLVKHAAAKGTLEQDTLNARLAGLEDKVAQLYKHLNLEPQPATQIQTSKEGPREKNGAMFFTQLKGLLNQCELSTPVFCPGIFRASWIDRSFFTVTDG